MSTGPLVAGSRRDVRIDWLRGLAMMCVIVDHSKRTSILSWFSYQRFWLVTAAEVFVVLSGVVLGMVYGPRLARHGWVAVMSKLGRRALLLYAAFIAVTLSILAMAWAGVDVSAVSAWDESAIAWFTDPRTMTAANWRDVALLRHGPWAFEIIGLYVWLVLAAGPCLLALRAFGWRAVLGISWLLYLGYRIHPQQLTSAEFEIVFPILAWQLLFVHGIAIGSHREQISGTFARCPRMIPLAVVGGCAAFMVLALSNPSVTGPAWLRWAVVSPERFAAVYERYFALSDLGIGRILNLAVALPVGYMVLTRAWAIAGRFETLFVTLGQASLGAFVLHVYGLLALSHLPSSDALWVNTLMQLVLIVGIAAILDGLRRWRELRSEPPTVLTFEATPRVPLKAAA
jgi:hypothetical protein